MGSRILLTIFFATEEESVQTIQEVKIFELQLHVGSPGHDHDLNSDLFYYKPPHEAKMAEALPR